MSIEQAETAPDHDPVPEYRPPYLDEALEHEAAPEIFRALGDLLHEPAVRRRYDRSLGLMVEKRLASLVSRRAQTEVADFDEAAWRQCYDPSQPTLGARLDRAFGEADILAMAAQRLRAQGEAICNITILPNPAFGQEHVTAEGTLIATSGIMVGMDGIVRSGTFPTPLRIDAVSSEGNIYLSQHRPVGVSFINDPDQQQGMDDKSWLHGRLRGTTVPHAAPLMAATPTDNPVLHRLIRDRMDDGKVTAIKPADGSLGRQVLKADPTTRDTQSIIDQLVDPRRHGSHYIAEPWIESLPYRQPETDVEADWSVRVLVVGHVAIAAYARVAAAGEAVNKARGARAVRIEDVLERCGLDQTISKQVIANIYQVAEQTAQVISRSRFLGIDIIVGPDLSATTLEANGENSGGLVSMTELATDQDHGRNWAVPEATIRALHTALFVNGPAKSHSAVVGPHHVEESILTPDDILHGLWCANVPELASDQQTACRALEIIYDELTADQQQTVHTVWHGAGYLPRTDYRPAMDRTVNKFSRLALERAEHQIVTTIAKRLMGLAETSDTTSGLSLNLLDLHHDDGALLYEPLNRYVRDDPTDLHRHVDSSRQVLQLMRVEPARLTSSFMTLEASDGGNAEAIGRALLIHAFDETATDYGALAYATLFRLEEHFAAIMRQQPSERDYTITRELASTDKEWQYLQPLSHRLMQADALAHDRYDKLEVYLMAGLEPTDEPVDAQSLAIAVHERYSSKGCNNTLPAAGQMVAFLAMAYLKSFPQAYHQLGHLTEDDRLIASGILERQIWRLLSDQPLTAEIAQDTERPDVQLALQLFEVFDIANHTDLDAAWKAYDSLATLLFREHPQLADIILPNLQLYLDNRAAGTSSHS